MKRKIRWDRVAALLIAAYMIAGIGCAAIDSHQDPERHACIVQQGISWGC